MKKCPYCAELIQDEAIKCRYCGSMLSGPPPPPTAPGNPTLDNEVRTLLSQGQKIAAIKRVREQTHSGLRDAKGYVEALAAGGSPSLPSAAPPIDPAGTRSLALVIRWLILLGIVLFVWWVYSRHQ